MLEITAKLLRRLRMIWFDEITQLRLRDRRRMLEAMAGRSSKRENLVRPETLTSGERDLQDRRDRDESEQ